MQLVQRLFARQVPPPLDGAPQLRGQREACGDAVEAMGPAGDPAGDSVRQLSQAAGHSSAKCWQRMSRVLAVMVLQGFSASGRPLQVATTGEDGEPVGAEVGTEVVGSAVIDKHVCPTVAQSPSEQRWLLVQPHR